jgi:hypothetical protein
MSPGVDLVDILGAERDHVRRDVNASVTTSGEMSP